MPERTYGTIVELLRDAVRGEIGGNIPVPVADLQIVLPILEHPDWHCGLVQCQGCGLEFRGRQECPVCTARGRAVRLWTCGRGHIVELEPGTPPFEASCPVCAAADELLAALERIPELERSCEGWKADAEREGRNAIYWRERAERVEAAARAIVAEYDAHTKGVGRWPADILRAALTAVPAPPETETGAESWRCPHCGKTPTGGCVCVSPDGSLPAPPEETPRAPRHDPVIGRDGYDLLCPACEECEVCRNAGLGVICMACGWVGRKSTDNAGAPTVPGEKGDV